MARKLVANQDNTSTSSQTEPLTRAVARPIFGENVLAIDYNFAEKGILDDDITFSRSSNATQTNSSGLVAFAPHNLVPFSEDFNEWVDNGGGTASVAATITDPFGGNNAWELTGDTTNDWAGQFINVSGVVTGNQYAPSVYLKKGTSTLTKFGLYDSNTQPLWISVTLAWSSLGVPTVDSNIGASNITISDVGSGWYRISFTGTALNTDGVQQFQIQPDRNASSDGTVYAFGAQLENTFGTTPSTYNKTSGAAYQAPRFDYSADGYGDKKGLLIEEPRTNLDANSFAVGTLNQSTSFAASNEIDPSGGTSSYKLVPDTSSGFHYQYRTYTVTDATVYTYSVYVKPDGIYKHLLLNAPSGNAAGNAGPIFNLETGQQESFLTADHPTTVTECGNGWYRISVQYTTSSTLLRIDHNILPTTASSSYSGDGSSGMLFWGSQLEQGSFATSLIPTYGSTASRSADLASVSGTNFSRFFKDTEGTTVVDIQLPKGWEDTDFNRFYAFSDGTFNNSIQAWINASATQEPRGQVKTGGVDQGSVVAKFIKLNTGEITRLGQVYKTNDHQVFIDGAVGSSDTIVSLPTNLNTLNIGSGPSGASRLSGWIRRLRYFNKKKTNTQVQKLTDTSFLLDKFKGAKAAHSLRSLRDGRDNSPVCSVRRSYDSAESSYTAAQVSNGDLEKDFRSADQTTLPLDVSVEADEMVTGGDFTDMVTNGTFDTDSGWTKGSGATIGSGVATIAVTGGGYTYIKQNLNYEAGRQYTVVATVNGTSGKQVRILDNGSNQGGLLENQTLTTFTGSDQTLTFNWTANSNSESIRFDRVGTGDWSFTVDNVSVIEGSWTLGTGWTLGGGVATHASGSSGGLDTPFNFKKGKTYDITFDVISCSGGSGSVQARGNGSTVSQIISSSTIGSNTFTYTDQSNHNTLRFDAGSGTTMSIDNISVKEVNPIGTGFSTRKINSSYTGYAMRVRNNDDNIEAEVSFDSNNQISLDSPVKATSMNLLDHSENFGEWTVVNSVALTSNQTDPLGGQNAYLLQSTTTSGNFIYADRIELRNIALSAGQNYTASVYIKQGPLDGRFRVQLFDDANSTQIGFVDVDFSSLGVPSTVASTSATNINYEAIGSDGWYRMSFTSINTTATADAEFKLFPDRQSGNDDVYVYGAMLEETVYESTGTEKITNGDFSDGTTDWSTGNSGTLTVDNGALVVTGDGGSYAAAKRLITTTVGAKYKLTGQGAVKTGSYALRVELKQGSGSWQNLFETTNTTMTPFDVEVVSVDSSWDLRFTVFNSTVTSSESITIDDISVLEYDPVLQTYTQTPVISDAHNSTLATNLREFAGKENLLDYSEDFSQSIYSKINSGIQDASQIVDPFGGNNAVRLAADTTNAQHRLDIPTSVGTEEHTLSVYAKAAEYGSLWLRRHGSSSTFNLENGTVISDAGNNNPTITPVGNDGWYRVSITNTGSANDIFRINFAPTATPTSDYAGDGTSGIYIFGAQLNTNSLKDYQKTTGTAKTADVHVVNWYDQGMGEDFTQSTAGEQPRIVMGSELVTDSGGKASVYFDGGDTLDNNTLAGQNRLDIYAIQDTSDNKYVYPTDPDNSSRYGLVAEDSVTSTNLALDFGTPSYYVNGALQSFTDRDDAHDVLTGSTKLLSQHNASTGVWTGFTVGHYHNGSTAAAANYTGKISEMVFFANMDSSPKRFPIEQNMIQHFMDGAIYSEDFNDDTGGWLDSEGGGSSTTLSHETANPISGSGSLKINLTNTGTSNSYPRVRKDTGISFKTGVKYRLSFKAKLLSGTAKADIRFGTSSANMYFKSQQVFSTDEQTYSYTGIFDTLPTSGTDSIDFLFNGTLGPFELLIDDVKVEELGVEGYLTTLYDQAGNNCHATQSTAANQPQLVNGGDLIKSGGHPAWEFTSDTSQLVIQGLTGISHLDSLLLTDTSDTKFMLGNSSNTYFMLSAESGSTHSPLDSVGGSPTYRINGSAFSGNRGQAATSLNGRKLLYILSGATTNWNSYELGDSYYDSSWSYVGKMSETLFWDSDQSGNQLGLESNINTHYNIYS